MSAGHHLQRLAGLAAILLLAAPPVALRAQVVVAPGIGAPASMPTVPGPAHDAALEALAAGGYRAALEAAGASYQTALRFGAERWIDSIAAAALLAECHYELGNFPAAAERCEEAMLLQSVHHEWTLRVQYPPAPPPAAGPANVPWGKRPAVPLAVPDVMAIRHQPTNPQQVLQRGGLLAAPFDTMIRPQVIVRSLAMAIYRHRELLGELAARSGPLAAVSQSFARRAPQDGYANAWLESLLGIATWAQGKPRDAEPLLLRSLMVDNRFDHVVTPWSLIVLGRIAFDGDRAAAAAALFEDAAVAAEAAGDARALEEAFRLAFAAHMVAGTRGPPRSIVAAAEWAPEELAVLRSRLFAMQAECLAAAGDARGAASSLRRIDGTLLRGDAGRGVLGAEAAYASAMNAYATGRAAAGDGDLERALAIMAPRSPRLFQTSRVTELVAGGSAGLSERQADELFASLLSGPTGRDFAAGPLESLAVASAARGDAFETWIAVAARRSADAALDAAEAATRARWLQTLAGGGRRVAVDRLLDDAAGRSPEIAARRAAILGQRPELARILERMQVLGATLANRLTPGPGADPHPPANAAEWTEYLRLTARRGDHAAAIAAGRDPLPIDVPPLAKSAELRGRLAPRQLVLSFHWTKLGLFGALESRDRTAVWQVLQAAALPGEIRRLAKDMCLFDPTTPVTTDKLRSRDWRPAADSIERLLFEQSKIALAEGIDELVIVPDGWLWYLPFELLPVASGRPGPDAPVKRLREACRIRYAPSRSLALMPSPGRLEGAIGVHAGRITRGEKPGSGERFVQSIRESLDGVVPLDPAAAAQGPPLPLVTAACEAVAIFDEISAEEPRAARGFITATKGGMRFSDWLAAPAKRTRRLLLPGLQTAMAGGLSKPPQRPGEELFLMACDIVTAGVPTAVLSRWRVGGQGSAGLMVEFLRDSAPHSQGSPAESWRRAVDIATAERPDPELEPRIRQSGEATLADATHPFFWAGYLLIDCGVATDPAADPRPVAAPAPPQPAPQAAR